MRSARTTRAVTWVAALLAAGCGGGGSTPTGTQRVASFSVGSDESLSYPNSPSDPPYLIDLPDEHTTFFPLSGSSTTILVFAASALSGASGGATVLETADLTSFQFATGLGYARQVMAPPVPITQCNSTYATEFDENYAAPGSVVQDPTLPPGNLIMVYEAENHCPGGVNQHDFYATVGFARSSDYGRTWPGPANSVLGNASRYPILKSVNAQPSGSYTPMGDAIPSAFVDGNAQSGSYIYVAYNYYDGGEAPASDHLIRVARAKLGTEPLVFQKWYSGAFSQPGIGGLDSGVLPGPGCPNGAQGMPEISFNDDLGLYLMVFVCQSGSSGSPLGAWYYSTATSLTLQDWSTPSMVLNSQFPVVQPCPGLTTGGSFDGWYPSLVSAGAAAGHTKLSGKVFFLNGCDTGARQFMARTFAITPAP